MFKRIQVMQQVNMTDATAHLLELVDAALKGETVLIIRDDHRAIQLVPVAPKNQIKQKSGSAAEQVTMSEDFDAPLSDFKEYNELSYYSIRMPFFGLSLIVRS